MTSLYRKKPLPIEARQLLGSEDGQTGRDLADWCGGSVGGLFAEPKVLVPTLEGGLTARVGDWIVKGPRGEFWPVKGDIFADTYDECPPAGEFFEQGHTYATAQGFRFECLAVGPTPWDGTLRAVGYLTRSDGSGCVHGLAAEQWADGAWDDITEEGGE